MRQYYTRPCNFFFGNYAKLLVKQKIAFPLNGLSSVAFDHIEIFQRKKKQIIKSKFYHILEIKNLGKKVTALIKNDLKNMTTKRKKRL